MMWWAEEWGEYRDSYLHFPRDVDNGAVARYFTWLISRTTVYNEVMKHNGTHEVVPKVSHNMPKLLQIWLMPSCRPELVLSCTVWAEFEQASPVLNLDQQHEQRPFVFQVCEDDLDRIHSIQILIIFPTQAKPARIWLWRVASGPGSTKNKVRSDKVVVSFYGLK